MVVNLIFGQVPISQSLLQYYGRRILTNKLTLSVINICGVNYLFLYVVLVERKTTTKLSIWALGMWKIENAN